MKCKGVVLAVALTILLSSDGLWARPTTADEAQMVVKGWLRGGIQPFGVALGRHVADVESFYGDDGRATYYIVNLDPSGFVIVPADDSIEPIIGFADDGVYDSSFDNPLGALVTSDLNGRIARASQYSVLAVPPSGDESQTPSPRTKWGDFINVAENPRDGYGLMNLVCVSDVRVLPLIQSKWGQMTVCGQDCYNYYVPNHYPCGCLATAMAQVMRYFQYPSASIGSHQFQISVEGHERTVRTRGGDGLGGPYRWDDMVLKPESNCGAVTEAQRQAIGALCYDAGVAAYMLYESGGSASLLPDGKDALLNTFQYGNAVMAYDSGRDISGHLRDVINPNLDAKAPVILAIINPAQPDSGHAVVCDGYGYESSTLYHHLNMGWEGTSDIWYNLPDIDSEGGLFTSVFGCIYNIRISGTGEIISGRVLDVNARPMANVSVYAEATGQTPRMAVTDDRGIYAIEELSPSTTYTIQPEADGYVFSSLLVQTGNSRDGLASSGNRWGIDFRTESAIEALPPLLVYVDAGAPDDPQANDPTRSDPLEDGSAEHPFDAIQEAIDAASAGDVVMILAGTYTGAGNRDLDFKGKAITVRRIHPNDPVLVVMNCQGSSSTPHRGFAFHSYETSSSVLNGVTITGGYYDQGGAIYCEDCAGPTVMNCVFEQNAASIGGAIFNENAGPTLTNCTFNDNSAQAGGAIYSHGELGACSPVLTSCIFSANTAAFNGGAVYSLGEYAEPTLVDCVFIRNSASSDGGGAIRNIMSSGVTLTNCLFVENSAMTYGGAIRCSIGSTAVLNNCTLSGNVAGNGNALACSLDEGRVQAPCTVQIINCILWDGGGEIYNKDDSTIAVTYSDVEGGAENGPWPGEGNIDADPYFADPAADDYHLMSQAGRWDPTSQSWLRDKRTSPCIDVGDASMPVGLEPSPNGGIVNIGAYGGTAEASKSYSHP